MTTVNNPVQGTNGTSSANNAAKTATTLASDNMSMYLEMLLTQLQFQDPLKPVDTDQLTSQLTMYSQLEQQMTMNEKLDALISLNADFSSTNYALSYLGRDILVESNEATVKNGSAEWTYLLENDAAVANIQIYDQAGNIVYSGKAETGAGKHSFKLDVEGLDIVGDSLKMVITAESANGTKVNTGVLSFVNVDSVDMTGAVIELNANGKSYSISDVWGARTV